ncbi:DUF7009 family protein [Mucilaginibacter flavidus]|uniref:DUF7009 family protein n=1 Tax=Mucilaginibacter flavidus TaxID=2949309 RepID=UPI0020940194|nr:hypothetical protein [Mucilaginibacter flavidus]MCO5948338.1 hypothetical protein [Mucilaginibacter flavidus]
MKIRIKGNSLRYRLTRSDVDKFLTDGYIAETTDFGMQTLEYALQQNRLNNLSAIFEGNKITVFMPKTMAQEWYVTDRVGFEWNANGLNLLVEKDFKCLDEVAEDQSDNYPNPLAKFSKV